MKRNLFVKVLSVILALICVFSQAVPVLAVEYASVQVVDPVTGETYYYSVSVPDKCEKPEIVSITKNSVKLQFYGQFLNENSGYEISVYENGVYTPVKYVTEKYSYTYKTTVNHLSSGKRYKLAVRAYNVFNGVAYYGEYSDILTVYTATKAVKLKSAAYISKGKIKVKWTKKKNVTGYIIQYSTSKKFPNSGKTTSIAVGGEKTLSKVISGLAKTTYYVRVCPYNKIGGVRYCGEWSNTKKVKVKKGLSVKELLNSVKTNNNGRQTIKNMTKNKVDIAKYKTNYEKVKAIYDWHAKNYNKFAHCLACNASFNSCIYALYGGKEKGPDIYIAAGEVKNRDGSKVIHKWSVLYLAGVEYIFDPRLQGYTGNYTGTLYFGIPKSSSMKKMYLFDGWYSHWERNNYNVYCK